MCYPLRWPTIVITRAYAVPPLLSATRLAGLSDRHVHYVARRSPKSPPQYLRDQSGPELELYLGCLLVTVKESLCCRFQRFDFDFEYLALLVSSPQSFWRSMSIASRSSSSVSSAGTGVKAVHVALLPLQRLVLRFDLVDHSLIRASVPVSSSTTCITPELSSRPIPFSSMDLYISWVTSVIGIGEPNASPASVAIPRSLDW